MRWIVVGLAVFTAACSTGKSNNHPDAGDVGDVQADVGRPELRSADGLADLAAADTATADVPPDSTDASNGRDTSAVTKVQSLGYYTGGQLSYDSVVQNHASLTMVSADVFVVTSAGKVNGGDDLSLAAYTASAGIALYACVSNYDTSDFDPALGHAAMVTNKTSVISDLVALAQKPGWAGINVDFESLAYSADVKSDRTAYTSFVHDLAAGLHGVGRKLMLSVPGKTEDSASDTWSYPFDFAALAPDVDYLQLMTYDENGPGWSGPGPVSGADWVKSCVTYAATVVPTSKLLIGLPAYGYDWDLSASSGTKYVGTSVAWTDFAAVLATAGAATHWDATSQSPYVDYAAANGHRHELWYENTDSIRAKTALVTQYQLAGLSMWSLGMEDAAFWQAARAGL